MILMRLMSWLWISGWDSIISKRDRSAGILRLMRHILGLYSIEPSLTWEYWDPLGGSASVLWRYMPSEICTKYLGSRSAALISILQCSACNRYHSVVSRCKSCPISFILHIIGLFSYTEHKPSSFSLEQDPSGLISYGKRSIKSLMTVGKDSELDKIELTFLQHWPHWVQGKSVIITVIPSVFPEYRRY